MPLNYINFELIIKYNRVRNFAEFDYLCRTNYHLARHRLVSLGYISSREHSKREKQTNLKFSSQIFNFVTFRCQLVSDDGVD